MQAPLDPNAKRAELLARLGEQAETLRSSEGWLAWLETAAKFREYSFRNQLLILSQRPDATRVAGFKTWQSLGRQVRKGERGIAILAPSLRKVESESEEAGETATRTLVGFRVVHVFDIGQTDGAELPEHAMPEVRVADESLFDRLCLVASREGFEVASIPTSPNGARGWFEPTKRRITLVESFSVASRVRTLLHELGHAFDPECASLTTERDERELLAESVAYLLGTDHGVELSDASGFYVASWGGDRKRLEKLATSVLDVARRVEAAINQNVEVAA